MRKLALVFLISVLLVNMVAAQDIWTLTPFKNNLRLYGSAVCNVPSGNKIPIVRSAGNCPSELGWVGDSITFKFKASDKVYQPLSNALVFRIGVAYYMSERPIKISVNGHTIVSNFTFSSCPSNIPGVSCSDNYYSFEFPKSLLNSKNNEINILMSTSCYGYGCGSQGFVLGEVGLRSK